MFRSRAFIAGFLGLIVFSPICLSAKTAGHWYPPHPMAKVNDATSRVQFMGPHLIPQKTLLHTDSPSIVLGQLTGSKLGINLFFTVSGVEEKSVGLLGLTTTKVPYREDLVISIVYADIESYEIVWDNSHGLAASWCVYPQGANRAGENALCVATQQDAEQLVDALSTLGIAYGANLHIPYGASLVDVADKDAQKHPEMAGLRAYDVDGDGPIARAGIEDSDILHTVDGKPCTRKNLKDAVMAATAKPDGGTIHIGIVHRGKPATADVTYPNWTMGDAAALRKQVDDTQQGDSAQGGAGPAGSVGAGRGNSYRLGINARAVADADAASLGLPKAMGLLVTKVDKGSIAEDIGIQTDDVILQADGTDVNSVEEFAKLVHDGTVKSYRVWRKGQKLDLAVSQSM